MRAWIDQGGVPGLLAKLRELGESMWSRNPHHDIFSGHGVLSAVNRVCEPLLYRVRLAGDVSEPLLPEKERWQVARAVRSLEVALHYMAAKGHRD
ncbi:hypothetical protein [Streptomyces sp. NBC_01718]|uniref:hypothetical protein n=1 Tax=Streptomyces sp. NBC_01718 TaxID=2975919 RepID=UPI00352E0268